MRLELARLLVQRRREGEGEVAPAAVMLVGDGVDDGHRAGQRELELAAGMRARRLRLGAVDRALAADRADDGRHLGLVAVGADADHGLLAEIDAVEIGEEAVDEVHAGLLAVARRCRCPASSCIFTARMVASSFACSRAAPASFHGAHSRSGSASQVGFGRLPASVVCSIGFSLPVVLARECGAGLKSS